MANTRRLSPTTACRRTLVPRAADAHVHLADLREPRLEEFPLGGEQKAEGPPPDSKSRGTSACGQDARFGHGAVAVRVAADPVA